MELTARVGPRPLTALRVTDIVLMWAGLVLWVGAFLLGTLVNSGPYRDSLAGLQGGLSGVVRNGMIVVFTYTLTNIAILCVLAGLLGTLGAKARLGTDHEREEDQDSTFPLTSSVLRAFLVYLLVVAGLLILGDDPASPTQRQYVRLAGFISLLGFVVNYRPALFGRLLKRAGALIEDGDKGKEGA